MTDFFDGRQVRDQIVEDLKKTVQSLDRKPKLSVIWVGDDKVTAKYVAVKERIAKKIGVSFELLKFNSSIKNFELKEKVMELNNDSEVDGIMIQLPLPKNIHTMQMIKAIDPKKDVDGLRFCADMSCALQPPVVLSILSILLSLDISYAEKSVAVIGQGFLVGSPLIRVLKEDVEDLRVADSSTPHLATITRDADIIITAAGKGGLITPDMIKKGVVLIDAGTSEQGGSLMGDIDPGAYDKASFVTPVPGGVGPVTVAMLFKNLVQISEDRQNA